MHKKTGVSKFMILSFRVIILIAMIGGLIITDPGGYAVYAVGPTAQTNNSHLFQPQASNPRDETPPPAKQSVSVPSSHIGSGSYGPPDANDTVFTIDSAPTLDEYRFVDQSPILFDIIIDRVVGRTDANGYLLEPDVLINNGIITPKVKLQLMVYDVDEDYSGSDVSREIDKIFVNGNYVGNLSGANNTWSAKSVDIDVRYLKFAIPRCQEFNGSTQEQLSVCHDAPTAVANQFRVDIDTGNNGNKIWAVTVDWAALFINAARPTLFVHGKGGSKNGGGLTYWDANDETYYTNFRGRFSSDRFLTGITENRLGAEAFIQTNAAILKDIVGEMIQRYGVDKINILAHSKGGLDSRAYISSSALNPNNNVAALFTLATPHHGSYLASLSSDNPWLASFLGDPTTDAVHDLTENYVTDVFNPSTPARDGVKYYALAADAGADYWYGRDTPIWQALALPEAGQRLKAGFAWAALWFAGRYKGDNDYLVGVKSADYSGIPGHNASNTVYFGSYDLNHHSIRAGIHKAGESDDRVADLVKSVFDVYSGSSGSWDPMPVNVADTASGPANATTQSFFQGTILQGQNTDQKILVDSNNHAVFTLLWKNGELNFNLVNPQGAVITPATTGPNIQYFENRDALASDWLLAGKTITYDLSNLVTGEWTLRVIAPPSLPGGSSEWVIVTGLDSPLKMSLQTNQAWYPVGSQVTVTAALNQSLTPILGASVSATILAPVGTSSPLPLLDNGTGGDQAAGDGIYSGVFTAAQSGMYRLAATATGISGGGHYQRAAVTEFQTSSGAAAFGSAFSESTSDTNGNGLIDTLNIHVPVQINTAGPYTLTGTLLDHNLVVVGMANLSVSLSAGNSTVTLAFDGGQIAAKGGGGTFSLVNLILVNNAPGQPLREAFLESAFTTSNYSGGLFETPPIRLNGLNNSFGTDTDSNGKSDFLTYDLGVNLSQAGYYYWNAKLMDTNGFEFGWSDGQGNLPSGPSSLQFIFDGEKIFTHKVNGPYYLADISIWGSSGSFNQYEGIATASFVYSQFDAPLSKVFLALIKSQKEALDSYEPNDLKTQAYGPINSGTQYTSYISSNSDIDFYYLDANTTGKISIDLTNINSPTTDIDVELYNAEGAQVGGSWSTTSQEKVEFLPINLGRYYVKVYRCCGTNTPNQPYYLKATYNQAVGAGDISGLVKANNLAVPLASIYLYMYDSNTKGYSRISTITDTNGQYHFRGVSSLAAGQTYQIYYPGSLGPNYAGYASLPVINSYSSGAITQAAALDISPITLNSPNSNLGQAFPIQFTWSVRATSPAEGYILRLTNYTYNQYWYSSNVGHNGVYTMTGLPSGFVTDREYRWYVTSTAPDGSYASSYYSYSVNFSTSGNNVIHVSDPAEDLIWPYSKKPNE